MRSLSPVFIDPMMARLLMIAGAASLTACASFGGFKDTPDRDAVAKMLVESLSCKDKAGAEPCKLGEQPHAVELTQFTCVSEPLHSNLREVAHARCAYSGVVHRIDGTTVPLPPAEREFSFVDFTPGEYLAKRFWVLVE
jgi:hypothetical protein